MISAAEFPVYSAGSVFTCYENIISDTKDAADVTSFAQYDFDISVGSQDGIADEGLVFFEGGWDFDD
jgi:hypothetical protein